MSILFDADAAASSELAARRRARTLVSDLDFEDSVRAGIVTDYVTARASGDTERLVSAWEDAVAMDRSRPGEPSLVDELHAASAGDLPVVA